MYPVLIKIFGVPIYSYGLFLALAFLVCIILILRRAVIIGINPHEILDLSLYIIISGVLGARLLYVVFDFDYYVMHPFEILLLNKGGLVFYGGFIFSVIVGILFAKKRKLPVLVIIDLFFLYLPLGQAIGRIGCFLNGCCYGKPTESIFGVQFPEYSFSANQFGINHWVYPAQIYSSVTDLVIFVILGLRMKYKKYNGQIALYYMFLYGTARFLLEYIRADNPSVFYGLNIPQIVSILMIITAAGLEIIRLCRGKTSTISQ